MRAQLGKVCVVDLSTPVVVLGKEMEVFIGMEFANYQSVISWSSQEIALIVVSSMLDSVQ